MAKPRAKHTARRRHSCIHEAGHAFVRWFFGFETDRAVVQTAGDIRAGKRLRGSDGRLVACHGMVSGPPIFVGLPHAGGEFPPPGLATLDRWVAYRRDVELIHLCAGFHAQAHHARRDPNATALSGGLSDLAQFGAVMQACSLDRGSGEREALEARVTAWTRALVRSPQGSMAIRAIADALMVTGRLSGVQIARLCREAYGGQQCVSEAWVNCWPPTGAQLKAGFMPEGAAGASVPKDAHRAREAAPVLDEIAP